MSYRAGHPPAWVVGSVVVVVVGVWTLMADLDVQTKAGVTLLLVVSAVIVAIEYGRENPYHGENE